MDTTLQTIETSFLTTTQGPLPNYSSSPSHHDPSIVKSNDCVELRQKLRLAELNNAVLQNNINTLKSVAHQLAAQLDLANNQLQLYEEKAAVRHVIEQQKQTEDLDRANEISDNNDYEERLVALRAALKEKDECLAELRCEMVRRDAEANALMRTVKKERDTTVLRLMNELDQLRRVIDIDKRSRVKRK